MSASASSGFQAARLLRWEERALLGCFLISAIGVAYALEQPLLLIPGGIALLLYPFLRRRGVRASVGVEGALVGASILLAIPLGIAAREPAPSLALFLLVAQGIKTLAPRGERDRGTSCLVGMVLTGVAASEAVDPPIILLLLGACGSVGAFAMIRNLRLHGRGESAPAPDWNGSPVGGRVFLGQAQLALVALLGTIVFFFVCPRVGAKFFANQRASRDRLAGFTDKVGLSDIGRIKQNDAVAFRVEMERAEFDVEPYWRGRALDIYDGETWRASPYFALTRRMLHRQTRQRFVDRRVLPRASGAQPETIIFYVEPLGTRCLFTVGNLQSLTFKQTAPRGTITRDDLGSMQMRRAYRLPIAYSIETFLEGTPSKVVLSDARRFKVGQFCSKLPGMLDVDRLRSYAGRALRDQRVSPEAPASQKAAALAGHLERHYGYSLEIDSTAGAEPIAEFLYERRKGHCELFASAHVFLLRSQGIPARIVTGFRGGEYSEWSGTYTIRQRDAHAWVEALTERGWERFDPTPAEARPTRGSQFVEGVSNLTNWLELRWFSLVIAFDAYDQRNFLVKLQGRLAIRLGMEDAPQKAVALAAGGLGTLIFLAAAGLGAWVLMRRRRREEQVRAAAAPSDAELAELLEVLAARGYHRQQGETPLELARRAGPPLGVARPLTAWISGYYARRYGQTASGRDGLAPLLRELAVDGDSPAP